MAFGSSDFIHYLQLLKPLTSIRRLRLWNGYFLRYDESAWDVTASDAMEGDDDVVRTFMYLIACLS